MTIWGLCTPRRGNAIVQSYKGAWKSSLNMMAQRRTLVAQLWITHVSTALVTGDGGTFLLFFFVILHHFFHFLQHRGLLWGGMWFIKRCPLLWTQANISLTIWTHVLTCRTVRVKCHINKLRLPWRYGLRCHSMTPQVSFPFPDSSPSIPLIPCHSLLSYHKTGKNILKKWVKLSSCFVVYSMTQQLVFQILLGRLPESYYLPLPLVITYPLFNSVTF